MDIAAPLLRAGGLLHIVGTHTVHTLSDPDGAIGRLVELADGSRATHELFRALHAEYPRIREQEVVAVVRELEDAGVFVDCARRLPAGRDRSEFASLYA